MKVSMEFTGSCHTRDQSSRVARMAKWLLLIQELLIRDWLGEYLRSTVGSDPLRLYDTNDSNSLVNPASSSYEDSRHFYYSRRSHWPITLLACQLKAQYCSSIAYFIPHSRYIGNRAGQSLTWVGWVMIYQTWLTLLSSDFASTRLEGILNNSTWFNCSVGTHLSGTVTPYRTTSWMH